MSLSVELLLDPDVDVSNPKASMDVAFVLDHIEELDALAKRAKVPALGPMFWDDDGPASKVKMLDPQVGIRTLEALRDILESKPEKNPADMPEILIEEIQYLIAALKKAAKRKAKFRFMAA